MTFTKEVELIKKTKYNSRKVIVDGIKFDSKLEAERYKVLIDRYRKGEITQLRLQPHITIQEAWKDLSGESIRAITYVADFSYLKNGVLIYEDAKGVKTDVYILKHKLVLDIKNIKIVEITKANLLMDPGGEQS